jgi:predicted ABC-type transport system involved in lysophospholipase L1 biosynthesis ATPase subunit
MLITHRVNLHPRCERVLRVDGGRVVEGAPPMAAAAV